MKNDMKLIMESWRRSTSEFDPIYVENILGIKIPLVEGRYRVSESLREEILIQENFFKNFFKGLKDSFFDKLGALGSVMRTLYQVITDPSKIKTYVTSIMRTRINPYIKALKKIKQKLAGLNMPTFASGVNKILQDIEKIKNEGQPVRKAVSFTSMVLLLEWVSGTIKDSLKEYGDQKELELLGLADSIGNLGEKALNVIQNILIKKLPIQMAKLFTAIAATAGAFPAWALAAVKLVQGATWAGEALKNTLASFKTRTDRQAKVAKLKAQGKLGTGTGQQLAKRDDL